MFPYSIEKGREEREEMVEKWVNLLTPLSKGGVGGRGGVGRGNEARLMSSIIQVWSVPPHLPGGGGGGEVVGGGRGRM